MLQPKRLPESRIGIQNYIFDFVTMQMMAIQVINVEKFVLEHITVN